jgi:hypothetical protein
MNDDSPWPKEEAPHPVSPPMSSDERKALAGTLTTLGFLIPVSIVLTVDWFINKNLSWSFYVVMSLGTAWIWALIPLFLNRKPYLLIAALAATAMAAAFGIGLLSGNTGWLLPIALPIIITVGLLSSGVTALTKSTGRTGGNLAAWILQALAVLSIITDILLNSWMNRSMKPGWSIITVSTLIPISILLLYLHYRPTKQRKLRRYFHV